MTFPLRFTVSNIHFQRFRSNKQHYEKNINKNNKEIAREKNKYISHSVR